MGFSSSTKSWRYCPLNCRSEFANKLFIIYLTNVVKKTTFLAIRPFISPALYIVFFINHIFKSKEWGRVDQMLFEPYRYSSRQMLIERSAFVFLTTALLFNLLSSRDKYYL